MERFNQVILSIGSNQGDRLKHLQDCVDRLKIVFEETKAISFVYETPAWGFESEPFYNAAVWIETKDSPLRVLQLTQQIEAQMGKIQQLVTDVYQARLIDIDIVWFDDQIIDLPNLKIPHPHFHNRNFVLFPIAEFGLDWIHPVLNKNISDLIDDCLDTSECKKVFEFI